MASINLLGSLSRVETPFVKVKIGKYIFGVADSKTITSYDAASQLNQVWKVHRVVYPNYIQTLTIKKINGQVNTYTLNIKYPVTQGSDPNFFEKVFSSVSRSRDITFSYGDLSVPNYIYKDEEAIIIDVQSKVSATQATIDYTVSAISRAALTSSSKRNFQAIYAKPSDRIKWLLKNNDEFGLQDIFYGMRDYEEVIADGLIRSDDAEVQLEYKANISVLDYLNYLIKSMIATSDVTNKDKLKSVYTLVIYDDTSGKYDGPYFKVVRVDKQKDYPEAYEIDIGYPSQNIVTEFSINTDESYSIIYDYTKEIVPTDYTLRVNRKGELEEVYSPLLYSENPMFTARSEDRTWWARVTEFPITVTLTLKGLLRPAILMTHVRLNVYFYGQKHMSSGLYIITEQTDNVGVNGGFRTTLKMLKIAGDDELEKEKEE